jgi:hypothetical protein
MSLSNIENNISKKSIRKGKASRFKDIPNQSIVYENKELDEWYRWQQKVIREERAELQK